MDTDAKTNSNANSSTSTSTGIKLSDGEPFGLKNPLVASICLDYADDERNKLPNTQLDKTRIFELFNGVYKYDVYESARHLEKKDFDQFLNDVKDLLLRKKRMKGEKEYQMYDGLIFVYSGHGTTDVKTHLGPALVLSDGTPFPFEEIRYLFGSSSLPQFAAKPKIFISDACRGGNTAEPVVVLASANKTAKSVASAAVADDDSKVVLPAEQNSERMHPGINSAMIFGNTIGYITFDRHPENENDRGGRLIKAMCKLFAKNSKNALDLDLDSLTKFMSSEVGKTSLQKMVVEQITTLQYNVHFQKRQSVPVPAGGNEFKLGTGYSYSISSFKSKRAIKLLGHTDDDKVMLDASTANAANSEDVSSLFLLKDIPGHPGVFHIQACGSALLEFVFFYDGRDRRFVFVGEHHYTYFDRFRGQTCLDNAGLYMFYYAGGDRNDVFYIKNAQENEYVACDGAGNLVLQKQENDEAKWVFTPAWDT